MINSVQIDPPWATIQGELRRCFSTSKTRVHAITLLDNFPRQGPHETLRSYIYRYSKLHRESSGTTAANETDLHRKLHFLKRIRNLAISHKICKSDKFGQYDRYSLRDCFERALELEAQFQLAEGVTLATEGSSTTIREIMVPEEVNEVGDPNSNSVTKAVNSCWHCGLKGHFAHECPQAEDPLPEERITG